LKTGAQTEYIDTTIKDTTHTHTHTHTHTISTLSLVSSITRSYALCLISFNNPQTTTIFCCKA